MSRCITFVVLGLLGVADLFGQWHAASGEAAGNYSSLFLSMANRSGLRNGWKEIPDTLNDKSSEFMLLARVLVPVAGDITESSTLAVSLEVPYVSKQASHAGKRISRMGIGDLALAVRYGFTIYAESLSQLPPFKARVDLIGKVKFPTGESQGNDMQGVALSRHIQLGSGSTDYAFGFAILTETQRWFMIHGHALYTLTSPANGFRAGNSFDYRLALLLAALPIDAEPVGTLLPLVGVEGMHTARSKMGRTVINDSGGDLVILSAGVQSLWSYMTGAHTFFSVETSYHHPVLQRVNGAQTGYASSFSIGVRVYVK